LFLSGFSEVKEAKHGSEITRYRIGTSTQRTGYY
jgi:hypothetical protein